MSNWKEQHSVTCAICGELADERETTNLTDDIAEIGPVMEVDNPERFEAIIDAVEEFGHGEAHEDCFIEWGDLK